MSNAKLTVAKIHFSQPALKVNHPAQHNTEKVTQPLSRTTFSVRPIDDMFLSHLESDPTDRSLSVTVAAYSLQKGTERQKMCVRSLSSRRLTGTGVRLYTGHTAAYKPTGLGQLLLGKADDRHDEAENVADTTSSNSREITVRRQSALYIWQKPIQAEAEGK